MNTNLLNAFYKVELVHWWFCGRRAVLKSLLRRFGNTSKPVKILDVGCGTGSDLTFFSQFGKTVGLDLSPVAIDYCHKRGFPNVKLANALSLPFSDNTFDVVALLDVLEHIDDDIAVLKEAHRVLKPGGIVIVTAPALPFIWSVHDTMQNHLRRYTPSRLTHIARKTHFKKCYLSYFNFFLSAPIIGTRLLSKLPFCSFLTSINYGPNFNIAHRKVLNGFLTRIFGMEALLIRHTSLPIGISLVTLLQKPTNK